MNKVMLVDDNEEIRAKYKQALESHGFEVIEAPQALEVAEILMREQRNIGLILLDLQMPEVDGVGVFEIISEYTNNIPVMISSVLPIQDQKLKISKARDYFQKSEGEEVLISKVKTVLGQG